MKILVCHNFYQQPGGEDKVFAEETALLEDHGHSVVRYTRHNDDLNTMGKVETLRSLFWNPQTVRELGDVIETERPDVLHCHNTFPLISPSAYAAAKRGKVAVVQTLHNYRMVCPNAQFLRDGKVCTTCATKSFAWPAIRHACYRSSKTASAAIALQQTSRRVFDPKSSRVDRYIALTEFSKKTFVDSGLPGEKIAVKPNFVAKDPGVGSGVGGYAVFVGRLSEEKGIHTLLQAWRQLPFDLELKILGDGPLGDQVAAAAQTDQRIKWLGHQPTTAVNAALAEAKFLIMPSIWFETFGLSMIEAYAHGTPVIASNLGAMTEIVKHGNTGFLFEPGQAGELSATIKKATDDEALLQAMRQNARQEFEHHYSADRNYTQLIDVYTDAVTSSSSANKLEATA
ncbi:MAG: glycosyltransferase family 4 protein [Filomicrobium sp.]